MTRKLNIFYFSIVILAILSCTAPQKTIHLNSVFNEIQASRILEKGSNKITGSALIRQAGGGVVTCAGCEVFLYPATDYAKERFKILYGNIDKAYKNLTINYSLPENKNRGYFDEDVNYIFIPEYEKYHEYSRKTMGDVQGYFEFDELCDGEYFIVTTILWGLSKQERQGGILMLRVTLKDDETKNVVLAP